MTWNIAFVEYFIAGPQPIRESGGGGDLSYYGEPNYPERKYQTFIGKSEGTTGLYELIESKQASSSIFIEMREKLQIDVTYLENNPKNNL